MRFHVVGIGGTGMSAVARLLLARGHAVSGSDSSADWPLARALARDGATVFGTFDARNVTGADVVVRSSAYRDEHVEVAAARAAGTPIWRRQDAWRYLAEGMRVVAVAGTHGKTTTTAMVFTCLRASGLDPSLICGAPLRDLGTNAHAGVGEHLVLEADEYDRAFLALAPEVAVVTNVEHDHVDHFPTPRDVADAFADFAGRLTARGTLVACADDAGSRALARWASTALPERRVTTYGTSADAEWRIDSLSLQPALTSFELTGPEGGALPVRIPLLGAHNARNAAAAIAASDASGVSGLVATSALGAFTGTSRRLEPLGEKGHVRVVDDYAHHPTEIRAAISAMRSGASRVIAVFQPHTPTRLQAFFEDFASALRTADAAVVVETFASARERADDTQGAKALSERAGARYASTNEEAASLAASLARPGDLVLILGAGDVRAAGERLLELIA